MRHQEHGLFRSSLGGNDRARMSFDDDRWRQQSLRVTFGERAHSASAVGDDVSRFTLGDNLSARGPHDFVAEPKRALTQLGDVGADDQFVVIIRGGFVAAVRLGDDEKGVFVFFHVAVRETAGAAVVGSAYFEADQIVGILIDAHVVGFGRTDT